MFGRKIYIKPCLALMFVAFIFLLSGCVADGYEVKTEVEPGGSGEVVGGGNYLKEELVSVKAEPAEGYEFEMWKKDGEPFQEKNQEIKIEVERDLDLIAVFAQKTYELKLESSPGGSNFLAALEGSGTYQHGDEVEIEAEERAYGFRFKKWVEGGEKVSGDEKYRFTVEENRELKAVRELDAESLIQTDDIEGYLLPVIEGEAVGLINLEGETVVKPNLYLNQGFFYDRYGVRPVKVNETNPLELSIEVDDVSKTLVISYQGELISELIGAPRPDFKARGFNEHGTIVYDGNYYGFKDHHGNQVIDYKYEGMETINETGLLKVNQGGKKGILESEDAEKIIEPEYDGLEARRWIEHGIYKASKGEDSYLLDKRGGIIRMLDYDEIEPPAGPAGLIKVKQGDCWGMIDLSGEPIIEPGFKWISIPPEASRQYPPGDAVASYRDNSAIGFLDSGGEVIVEIPDNPAITGNQATIGNHLLFEEEGKKGLKTLEGEVVERPVFENVVRPGFPGICDPKAEKIVKRYAYFKRDGLWAVFDGDEFVTDFKFAGFIQYTEAFGANRPFEFNGIVQMIAKEEGGSTPGLYNLDQGEYIIPPGEYDHVAPLKYGRAMVVENDLYGYVDETGEEVIEPRYDQAVSFSHEAAAVLKGEKLKVIDNEGNQIAEPVKIDPQDFEDRPFPYTELTLDYLEGPGVYRSIENSYFDRDGWIKKP